MRTLRDLTVVLVIAAAAAACTTAPAPPPPEAAPTTTAAPDAITLPPRPRDIPIDDVDPCSLLTRDQLADLGLTGTPRRSTSSTRLLGEAPQCSQTSLDGDPNIALGVILAPETGIERYTGGELLTDVSPLTIEGFPAVLARPQPFPDVCNIIIDIAPGQLINVDFADGGANEPDVPQDQLCEGAQRVATAVMQTLLAEA